MIKKILFLSLLCVRLSAVTQYDRAQLVKQTFGTTGVNLSLVSFHFVEDLFHRIATSTPYEQRRACKKAAAALTQEIEKRETSLATVDAETKQRIEHNLAILTIQKDQYERVARLLKKEITKTQKIIGRLKNATARFVSFLLSPFKKYTPPIQKLANDLVMYTEIERNEILTDHKKTLRLLVCQNKYNVPLIIRFWDYPRHRHRLLNGVKKFQGSAQPQASVIVDIAEQAGEQLSEQVGEGFIEGVVEGADEGAVDATLEQTGESFEAAEEAEVGESLATGAEAEEEAAESLAAGAAEASPEEVETVAEGIASPTVDGLPDVGDSEVALGDAASVIVATTETATEVVATQVATQVAAQGAQATAEEAGETAAHQAAETAAQTGQNATTTASTEVTETGEQTINTFATDAAKSTVKASVKDLQAALKVAKKAAKVAKNIASQAAKNSKEAAERAAEASENAAKASGNATKTAADAAAKRTAAKANPSDQEAATASEAADKAEIAASKVADDAQEALRLASYEAARTASASDAANEAHALAEEALTNAKAALTQAIAIEAAEEVATDATKKAAQKEAEAAAKVAAKEAKELAKAAKKLEKAAAKAAKDAKKAASDVSKAEGDLAKARAAARLDKSDANLKAIQDAQKALDDAETTAHTATQKADGLANDAKAARTTADEAKEAAKAAAAKAFGPIKTWAEQGKEFAEMMGNLVLQMEVSMGAQMVAAWQSAADALVFASLSQQRTTLMTNLNHFFSQLALQQTNVLAQINANFSAQIAVIASQLCLQTTSTGTVVMSGLLPTLFAVEQSFVTQALVQATVKSIFLLNPMNDDQLFYNSPMAAQETISSHTPFVSNGLSSTWYNPYRSGNWQFCSTDYSGTMQNPVTSFVQYGAQPFTTSYAPNGSVISSPNGDPTLAVQNSIFTEYIPPAQYNAKSVESYTISVACTLLSEPYEPFMMGIMFNGARWISGILDLHHQHRLFCIYAKPNQKPGTYNVGFAETFYQNQGQMNQTQDQLSDQNIAGLNAIWPAYQILSPDINKLAALAKSNAAHPITNPIATIPALPLGTPYIFTIETQPNQVTLTISTSDGKILYPAGETASSLKTELSLPNQIQNLNGLTFLYHNIGFTAPGCSAQFCLKKPTALCFSESQIKTIQASLNKGMS